MSNQIEELTLMLAERDGHLRDSHEIIRHREGIIRQREDVVREREQAIRQREAVIHALQARTFPHITIDGENLEKVITLLLPQLEGWCSLPKALWLARLVETYRPRQIGEIGVYGGRSLLPMALAVRHNSEAAVYAIEPWSNQVAIEQATTELNDQWWRDVDLKMVKQKFLNAIIACDLLSIVKIYEMPSNVAWFCFSADQSKHFDLLHIDGSHAEVQALADVTNWLSLVKPGGIIVLDDISWLTVAKARDYLRKNCIVIEEIIESENVSYGAYRKPDDASNRTIKT